MNIPLVDLKVQYARHGDAFREAMDRVCRTAAFILGSEVERFEKNFAAFLEAKEVVGVANEIGRAHV